MMINRRFLELTALVRNAPLTLGNLVLCCRHLALR